MFAEDGGLAQLPPGPSRDVLVAIQGANAAQIEGALLTEMQAALKAKDRVRRSSTCMQGVLVPMHPRPGTPNPGYMELARQNKLGRCF